MVNVVKLFDAGNLKNLDFPKNQKCSKIPLMKVIESSIFSLNCIPEYYVDMLIFWYCFLNQLSQKKIVWGISQFSDFTSRKFYKINLRRDFLRPAIHSKCLSVNYFGEAQKK